MPESRQWRLLVLSAFRWSHTHHCIDVRTLLRTLTHNDSIYETWPFIKQRWSEAWNSDVVRAVVNSCKGARAELRAAALHVMAALAHHAQLLPQLMQGENQIKLSVIFQNISNYPHRYSREHIMMRNINYFSLLLC